jgi:hypothetical protein
MKTRGFVAFLDVLGFTNFILDGESFGSVYQEYVNIIKKATASDDLDYVLFSDSIIITADSTSYPALYNMCSAVSDISYNLLVDHNVPLCGCISCGSFENQLDGRNSIITGAPLVDAIHFEKQQNWIGVMLSPSVLKEKKGLKELIHPAQTKVMSNMDVLKWGSVLVESNIPFHESEYRGFAVIPRKMETNSRVKTVEDIQEYSRKLIELSYYAPSPYEQYKYNQSKKFMSTSIRGVQNRSSHHGHVTHEWEIQKNGGNKV